MKIRPVGAEFFHADGRTDRLTDMTKLLVAFAILRTRLKIRTAHYHNVFMAMCSVKHRNTLAILPDNDLVSVNFVMQLNLGLCKNYKHFS